MAVELGQYTRNDVVVIDKGTSIEKFAREFATNKDVSEEQFEALISFAEELEVAFRIGKFALA